MFVTEVEAAVGDGRADAAVHSAKDMPSLMPAGFVLGAVPRRPMPATASSAAPWPACRRAALVATGSARRRAQLAALRPDLVFTDLRGNMARRIAVAEEGRASAVVVAVAALERLGWESRLSDILDPVDVLPQAGQGAIAVQCRADDDGDAGLLAAIDHGRVSGPCVPSVPCWRAGRELHVPVGAFAEPDGTARRCGCPGLVASGDGHTVIRWPAGGRTPKRWARRWHRAAHGRRRGHRGLRRVLDLCRDRLPGGRRPG